MEKRKLEKGDVVQLGPNLGPFSFQFMIVTEPKEWGAQGCVKPLQEGNAQAYFRAKFENMEYIGKAVWAPAEADEDGDQE